VGVIAFLRRAGHVLHVDRAAELEDVPAPERLRRALEDLGPTFVKLGQVLAGRSDLLGPEWIQELSKLHEHVSPGDGDAALEQLSADLGAPPGSVFDEFDPVPFAAGSIAQVHAARLTDGTRVVLKVRRPGIGPRVDSDLAWLARLAAWLEQRDADFARLQPRALARQLARSLRSEMDLREEARNQERLRQELAGEAEIVLPRVHERYTCERLLVMDRLDGPSLGAWLASADVDQDQARRLAQVGAHALLHLIFRVGFFHADPHPGNVILLADGRMGLLDAGMVAYLSERRRLEVLELFSAAADGRVEAVVEVLAGWSAGPELDLDPLEADVHAFVLRYHDRTMAELNLTHVLRDVQDVLRQNDLVLPEDLAKLLKVFITLDGLGRALDPEFVMTTHLAPFMREALLDLRAPSVLLRRGLAAGRSAVAGLPRDLAGLRRVVRSGRIPVEVGMRDLDHLSRALARSTNRLTLGVVTSALIVGTAIALDASGPQALGLNAFALLGFVSSVLVGLALLVSLRR
jgi:ubiquinone biosynthesis protein